MTCLEVLFCHNELYTAPIVLLAERLRKRGVHVWLDVWEVRRQLRENCVQCFNRDEVRNLCADLGINHENLPDTLNGMVRELVAECDRSGRVSEIIDKGRQLRPNAPWPDKIAFSTEQIGNILGRVTAVLVLIRKDPWNSHTAQACLAQIAHSNVSLIPILLPGSVALPASLVSMIDPSSVINLQSGIDNSQLSLLLWRITSDKSKTLETGKALAAQIAKSRMQDMTQQRVDAWGIAGIKNRIHALSEIVATESAEEAIRAADVYPNDVLTLLIPLIVDLRWHRGYSIGMKRLLNISEPVKHLSDFACMETVPPCPIMEGVVSAEVIDHKQILVRLDGHDAVLVSGFAPSELETILDAVNQFGRLGAPRFGGLSIVQRIGTVPIRAQSANPSSFANALFRNREALIPLIARWGMPGSDWLLPADEDFSRAGESTSENALLAAVGDAPRRALQTEGIPQDVIVEDDFEALKAVQHSPNNRRRLQDQDTQMLEAMLRGVTDPRMREIARRLASGPPPK